MWFPFCYTQFHKPAKCQGIVNRRDGLETHFFGFLKVSRVYVYQKAKVNFYVNDMKLMIIYLFNRFKTWHFEKRMVGTCLDRK